MKDDGKTWFTKIKSLLWKGLSSWQDLILQSDHLQYVWDVWSNYLHSLFDHFELLWRFGLSVDVMCNLEATNAVTMWMQSCWQGLLDHILCLFRPGRLLSPLLTAFSAPLFLRAKTTQFTPSTSVVRMHRHVLTPSSLLFVVVYLHVCSQTEIIAELS